MFSSGKPTSEETNCPGMGVPYQCVTAESTNQCVYFLCAPHASLTCQPLEFGAKKKFANGLELREMFRFVIASPAVGSQAEI
jgi:hypothetical protein